MRFSSVTSIVGAGLVGLSHASPVGQYVGTSSVESRHLLPTVFNLVKHTVDETLYKGVVAPAIAGVQKEVDLVLDLVKADITGDISVEVTDKFLINPTIKVNLGGVKAYVEVELEASAAVNTTVELVASPKLSLVIPSLLEVDAGVAFALDLTLALSAAIDVEAGVYLTLPIGAYVEIDLLTKNIVAVDLEGLDVQALPITLGADVELDVSVDLTLGLRLRTDIGIEAGVDLLGLDIGAGAEVAVWISLFDYTTTLISIGDSDCPVSAEERFALIAGVAIDVDVEIGDILDLHLAPSVLVTLATGANLELCLSAPSVDKSHLIATSVAAGIGASSTAADVVGGTGLPNIAIGSQVAPGAGTGYTTNSAGSLVPTGTGLPVGSGAYPTGTGASSGYPATMTTVPYGNATATSSSGSGSGSGSDMVTSTITATAIYTVTSCAVAVPNCPASLTQKIVTSTVEVYTTVCPATATGGMPSSTYVPGAVHTPSGTPVSVTPCATPSTTTYSVPSNAPTPAPTVIIVDTTTVCPETQTGATKPAGTYVAHLSNPAGGYTPVSPPLITGTGASAPAGTGSYTYVTPKPSPVTAGAGKVAGGVAAVVLPVVAALML